MVEGGVYMRRVEERVFRWNFEIRKIIIKERKLREERNLRIKKVIGNVKCCRDIR